ncbi:RluA family pseudouridine synthase [Clostridium rectalis]|uniref:RluA family pseudouridine synthase n=1 Tax=Clostridium rectalis TaxID=2040295 RepID=UPI000F634B30|nr:RluA family pseudouridine synthase [Clostridium rectalis]
MEDNIFLIGKEDELKRVDVFLSHKIKDKSRSYIQSLIEKQKVKVNGKIRKSNYKLKENDEVFIDIPESIPLNIQAEDIPLDILYEDKDIIVVNKSQGMVVHPASGNLNGTLVNALLNHCKDLSGINGVTRPGIVHRIDKDTSGVLVVAKNDLAHNKLAEQLKNHSMNRIYVALVEGVLKNDEGIIDAPLGRHPVERIKIAVIKGGRKAITHYKVIKRFNNYTLVECKLETGRTHQIRVHMAYTGHPLVGDPVYGYKKQKFNLLGQMLHAKKLGFIHPSTNKYIEFSTELPSYYKNILINLEKQLK